jgi:hypothetical protein
VLPTSSGTAPPLNQVWHLPDNLGHPAMDTPLLARLAFVSCLVCTLLCPVAAGSQVPLSPTAPYMTNGQTAQGSVEPSAVISVPSGTAQPSAGSSGEASRQELRSLPNVLSPDRARSRVVDVGEFARYVASVVGRPLARFGDALLTDGANTFAPFTEALVPPDYILSPGAEILVS